MFEKGVCIWERSGMNPTRMEEVVDVREKHLKMVSTQQHLTLFNRRFNSHRSFHRYNRQDVQF